MCNEWLRPENFCDKIRVFSRSKHAKFTSKWDFFMGGGAKMHAFLTKKSTAFNDF